MHDFLRNHALLSTFLNEYQYIHVCILPPINSLIHSNRTLSDNFHIPFGKDKAFLTTLADFISLFRIAPILSKYISL